MGLLKSDFDFLLVLSLLVKVSGRIISSRNCVAKDISLGLELGQFMLQGVYEVAEAVKVTMGPNVYFVLKRFKINVVWIVLQTFFQRLAGLPEEVKSINIDISNRERGTMDKI